MYALDLLCNLAIGVGNGGTAAGTVPTATASMSSAQTIDFSIYIRFLLDGAVIAHITSQ